MTVFQRIFVVLPVCCFFFCFFSSNLQISISQQTACYYKSKQSFIGVFFLFTSASDFAKLETTKCLTYLGADIEIDILILWCQSSAELERSSDIALIY